MTEQEVITKQKIIKIIKDLNFCNICISTDCVKCKCINVFIKNKILESLERNIPKKLDKDNCCPVCGNYGKDDCGFEINFCSECGQKFYNNDNDE